MNNDLVFYAKKNMEDAQMMGVHIDECSDDDTNGPLDVSSPLYEVETCMFKADEILAKMNQVWMENWTRDNAKIIIQELKRSSNSIEKRNRAHRDFHKFVRSL